MSQISIIQNLQAQSLAAIVPSENMTNGSCHEILNILGARLVTNELLVSDLQETSDSILDNEHVKFDFEMQKHYGCASKLDTLIDDRDDRIDDKSNHDSCYRPHSDHVENLDKGPSAPDV